MKNPNENAVLMHLMYNLVGNELRLGQIDGYANCPETSARVLGIEMEVDDIEEVKS